MLKVCQSGSVLVDSRVMEEINTKKMPLIENVISRPAAESFEDGDTIHQVISWLSYTPPPPSPPRKLLTYFKILPTTLQERYNYNPKMIQVVTMEEAVDQTILNFAPAPDGTVRVSILLSLSLPLSLYLYLFYFFSSMPLLTYNCRVGRTMALFGSSRSSS